MKIESWPPSYSIKISERARYVRLKTNVQGLELIIPKKFNPQKIPDLLEKNRIWIEKKLAAITARRIQSECEKPPDTLHFLAIDQFWRIFYLKNIGNKLQLISRPQNELVILGAVENTHAVKKLLIHWLKKQAKLHLEKQLQLLSQKLKLPYSAMIIRAQQGRWGSCNAKHSISLNYKLLFLPSNLLNYVLIHELCHTRELNHSPKFWQLVAEFDPNWQQQRCELRQAEKWIPPWI